MGREGERRESHVYRVKERMERGRKGREEGRRRWRRQPAALVHLGIDVAAHVK